MRTTRPGQSLGQKQKHLILRARLWTLITRIHPGAPKIGSKAKVFMGLSKADKIVPIGGKHDVARLCKVEAYEIYFGPEKSPGNIDLNVVISHPLKGSPLDNEDIVHISCLQL